MILKLYQENRSIILVVTGAPAVLQGPCRFVNISASRAMLLGMDMRFHVGTMLWVGVCVTPLLRGAGELASN